MPSTPRSPLRSHAKAIARRDEEHVLRFRRLLAISVMSALTLGALILARADWVTVNPDGSVVRTETRVQADQTPSSEDRSRQAADAATMRAYDQYPQDNYGTYNAPSTSAAIGNTTFFSGTYYPIPSYSYTFPTQGGVTYPVGPVYPNVTPPLITTLPGIGRASGYGYPYPAYPPYGYYPQPVYVYPGYTNFPVYGGTGIYYSGPAGGGGTIYSSSTSSNNGYGVTLGNSGLGISIGNSQRTNNSTTTVTTYNGR